MEKLEIRPIYISGRYGFHKFIPFKNKWDGLGEEELNSEQQELFIPESYYRAIGENFDFPESIDLDGGPFMSIGSTIEDFIDKTKYRIDSIDCRGKYPILICSRLQ
jgi:hypothetical protein